MFCNMRTSVIVDLTVEVPIVIKSLIDDILKEYQYFKRAMYFLRIKSIKQYENK